ncbi:MAG: N-acetyl-1-D-myo-inositol-2-amino-2-deoxy-alpha-D-glucopyranoside deacetylase [Actinobacteria bacterium BACL4 MAG-121022-bin9]|uniref:N-acetyl-1-D-myo-inositol-2-amino-2-deoxy-alpha- D-glucopyranoside deacetylase n=1 Tax=Candidatus Nanopelagicus sp. TaxID=2518620 RepID=UPI000713B355|nr:MAG: N-acetyl-1-D-myo-inositol-2-amino-2-deoxy-alpha-D-glucopyranoside deacetylase [Actinobacteria bacterium BACL4 MAG-121022-bin9]KRO46006.1 MAG: N-acetyl-1-D-myo-inositol-2-amino-2-deoxy-alpha-D-glucopyranoside deacetylase [Actinobacteria bacterium BACL4 MAG-120813-bin39]KRO50757.1 MAG: N-acetyl-1-D-myo-inositol-2-amino-2-deoxy-alpha-D-glucopyranoside deacetylase [Actinobacteria bacterium BACL4 MAG-121001-bin59]MDA2965686.1 N-acetyl-1-D-myo-inositol-2-amino-2-deoxy-alpha-D-glucopyranoside d
MRVNASKRLLLVHAHPDDETINNGVTMAKYAAEGVQVTLVTCTRGEEGEVLVESLANLASSRDDKLGEHREIELKTAMGYLGIKDFRFLGSPNKKWRDSGMIGTAQNERKDVFWQADLTEAAQELVKIILEIKPQVLITYDEFGGYGHPDHIKAHQVAMLAAELASNQGWKISKIYWNTMPKSVIQMGIDKMKEVGSSFFGADSVEDLPFAKPDELVTSVIKAPDYVEKKLEAMKAHETQISIDGPFFALSNNLGLSVWADEYYTLVKGEKSKPFDESGREIDLFAGVTL